MKNVFYVLFFFTVIFTGINAAAQPSFPPVTLQSANQQFIEDAVKNGVFIVRRCYRLQDTTTDPPSFFGWQNMDYFGETFSLGIKVVDGYLLGDSAVRPWEYDDKFKKHAQKERFVPVLSTSEYKTLDDTGYKPLPFREITTKEISAGRVYLAQDAAVFNQKGFSVDYSDGNKKGWLVWLVSDKPVEGQDHPAVTFMIYRSELTFERDKESYEVNIPATDKQPFGGFYVLPEITDIGQINFRLAGALHNENGKWQVIRVKNTKERPAEGGLTPIMERNDTQKPKTGK